MQLIKLRLAKCNLNLLNITIVALKSTIVAAHDLLIADWFPLFKNGFSVNFIESDSEDVITLLLFFYLDIFLHYEIKY